MSLSAKTDIILDRTLHQRSLCHSDVGVSGQHVALQVRLFDALRIHGDDHVCTRRQDPLQSVSWVKPTKAEALRAAPDPSATISPEWEIVDS
jgi:hypothetical protein